MKQRQSARRAQEKEIFHFVLRPRQITFTLLFVAITSASPLEFASLVLTHLYRQEQ